MFGILENAKKELDLEDYSISQITLEQVFLTFANPEDIDVYAPQKKPWYTIAVSDTFSFLKLHLAT